MDFPGEDPAFLSQQLITYIGNKRALLHFIGQGLQEVLKRLNRKKLATFDVFSGSGIVARYLKPFSRTLTVCDLERYSEVINSCYLTNHSTLDLGTMKSLYKDLLFDLRNRPWRPGFIRELYSPQDDTKIQAGERVFYTNRNAHYLDTARQKIDELPRDLRNFFLAPLLAEASVHANTAGVFKGFYKNSDTGRGEFGGRKKDALFRILGDIELPFPLFSRFECETIIHRGDSNQVAREIKDLDVAYLDPPYNQHPYGSNYFMLNLLVDYRKPLSLSEISGIPSNWQRSAYNKRALALRSLEDLVEGLDAKFLIISFNSEGFIGKSDMEAMLRKYGQLETLQTQYNAFRGSRNLRNRETHVHEYLYFLEKH